MILRRPVPGRLWPEVERDREALAARQEDHGLDLTRSCGRPSDQAVAADLEREPFSPVEARPGAARPDGPPERVTDEGLDAALRESDFNVVIPAHTQLPPVSRLVVCVGCVGPVGCAVARDEDEPRERKRGEDQSGHNRTRDSERGQASLFEIRHVTNNMINAGR